MKGELGEFTERVAAVHPTQRAYRRWPGHAAGIPACEKRCRAGPARALLRDATWRVPREALRCHDGVAPRNVHEGKGRRKKRLPAGENRSPAGLPWERIVVASWPWRKGSLQKSASASSSTRSGMLRGG